jgi:hypothetical protein
VDRVDVLDLQRPTRLERHGARTLTGLGARIGLRLLALAAGICTTTSPASPDEHSPPTAADYASTI